MGQSAPQIRYTSLPLNPLFEETYRAVLQPVNLAPSTVYAAGQLLGPITSSANDVQTLTWGGSGLGGTFTLSGYNPVSGLSFTTAALAQAASNATVQAELRNTGEFEGTNVVVSGTPGTNIVLTFGGQLANLPVPAVTTNVSLVTGTTPSLSVTHTTVGRSAGTFGAYNSATVTAPAAPTVTGTGSGSAFGAGTYLVEVTAVNAQGETTASPAAPVTLTSAQLIHVAAVTGLNASVTALNVYVDSVLVGQCAVSAGTSTATNFDVASLTSSGHPPKTNTAYTIPNGLGTQTATCVNKYPCQTDAAGNISYSSTQATGAEWGQTDLSAPAYYTGWFRTQDLVGLDATAVTQLLGRLVQGTVSNGQLKF